MKASKNYSGVGIMFGNGLCGIDIDHCVIDGKMSDMAQDIIKQMQSYTEYSPSGTGIHILFFGSIKDSPLYYKKNPSNGVEIYQAGRFFTVTSKVAHRLYPVTDCTKEVKAVRDKYMKKPEKPTQQSSAQSMGLSANEIIQKAAVAKNGALFSQLWVGDTAGFKSQSEADLALCNILAFYTGRDPALIDSLFRQSGLMRDKWDRQQSGSSYGAITIERACADCREVYTGPIRTTAREDFAEVGFKPLRTRAEDGAPQSKPTSDGYAPTNGEPVESGLVCMADTYNEDEWAAFYESVIEPIAVQLSLEFTEKIFTPREQAFGNSIIFEANRLQFASAATKGKLISELMPLGLLTINQALEILNLPGVPDGDKRLQSLNMVNADKADKYQLGGNEK